MVWVLKGLLRILLKGSCRELGRIVVFIAVGLGDYVFGLELEVAEVGGGGLGGKLSFDVEVRTGGDGG